MRSSPSVSARLSALAFAATAAVSLAGGAAAQVSGAFSIAQLAPIQCPVLNHMGTIDAAEVHHLLNRMTFGPTSASIAAINTGTAFQSFVVAQLNPQDITENATLATILGQLDLPTGLYTSTTGTLSHLDDIQTARVAFAMLSERQLNEVMTQFWEDHFNTDYFQLPPFLKTYVSPVLVPSMASPEMQHAQAWVEWDKHLRVRNNALNTFESLLAEVILSPAMMLYLNTDQVYSCSGNQNYARELAELHTMGEVNKGTGLVNYTQADIVELAKVLSGWKLDAVPGPVTGTTILTPIHNPDPNAHCSGPKTLFAVQGASVEFTVPSGTPTSELAFLVDKLAAMDAVKDFVCRKLLRFFLSDEAAEPGPENILLANMKSSWGTNGNIRAVLCTLFNSTAFQGGGYRWQRVRSPLEKVVWSARVWDSTLGFPGTPPSFYHLSKPVEDVEDMGQILFGFPTPDGFPLNSLKRLGSSTTIETVMAYADIYRGFKYGADHGLSVYFWPFSPVPAFLQYVTTTVPLAQQDTPAVIAHAILDRLYPGVSTTVDETVVATALGTLDHTNLLSYSVALSKGIAVGMSFTHATLK